MRALRALQADFPSYQLYVTGHSLGASMASLMAASLLSADASSDLGVITFGEPRTGNAAFATEYSQALGGGSERRQHFRCVHADDIIPHYPFREMPAGDELLESYHHTAREVWLAENSSTHRVCDGSGEDRACSDSIPLWRWSGADHTSYFGLDAGPCRA